MPITTTRTDGLRDTYDCNDAKSHDYTDVKSHDYTDVKTYHLMQVDGVCGCWNGCIRTEPPRNT